MAKDPKSENPGDEFLTPEGHNQLRTSKPKENTAGVPGIVTAMKHGLKYMKTGQMIKTMFRLNQKGGIDCPGCAWPDPDDDRSKLGEFCENGMKAIAEEASKSVIFSDYFEKNSVAELRKLSDFKLGKLGRLGEPLIYDGEDDHYKSISWEEAFEQIGRELNQLPDPDQAAFYTSGRTSNEAAFLYQLFVRLYGTNNLPDCSNMCHESSGVGLSETLGLGKGSVTLSDIHEAELLIIMGQNPGTNHPRMLSALEKCKENGGKIISINPLAEAGLMKFTNPQRPGKMLTGGTTLTDLFLQVRINGDVALLKGIMKILLNRESEEPGRVFDKEFINSHTAGYEEFISDLEKTDLSECMQKSGVPLSLLETAADWIAQKEKIIVCWAMGLTQHKNAVHNIREIVNLLLLRGAIGKPGAGTCPVRGHSNVQGDRTMGIYEAPPEEFLDSLGKHFDFEPPRDHGYATVDTIREMRDGNVKFFMAMGGNFLSAGPDTQLVGEALSSCNMTVHISTKLNRSHLAPGKTSLILPCLGRTEKDIQKSGVQFVTVENSMGVIHSSQGVLPPCSKKLKSEVAIVCHLAKSTLNKTDNVDWEDFMDNYDRIRASIEAVLPGFENYNHRIKLHHFFYLPNGPRNREFKTSNGKANFSVNPLPDLGVGDNEFIMMTIRSHDQFNTTIYGLDDRYRGIYNERRVVMMNPKDMKIMELKSREVVDLVSNYRGVRRTANKFIVVPYDIPVGCVGTYFPEANSLVPFDEYADKSKTPISKSVKITVEKLSHAKSQPEPQARV
jgi:molybdopterin-dependent oxidoreductase alpha subunit